MSCCGKGILGQMAELRNRALANYCDPTGASPLFQEMVLRTYDYTTETYSYKQITPTPFVDENPQGSASEPGVDNLNGEDTRYQAHISRAYDRVLLEAQTTDFIISGSLSDLSAGDRFSGILCELETIDDKVTYWEITLVEKVTEQTFTLV